MDFAPFDRRGYERTDVARGYGEWAASYDGVVRDQMDLQLLGRLEAVPWASLARAADLACGTGRVGAWLRSRGVRSVDGVDITPQMLERARARGVYEALREGDLRAAPFADGAYDLVTVSLADEHLPDLAPLYDEAARLLRPRGWLVLAGYHPQFLMVAGMPTHYHRPGGEPVAIETHVHLLSDHVRAARPHFALEEMHEGLVDDAWIAARPRWAPFRHTPVSFVLAWALK